MDDLPALSRLEWQVVSVAFNDATKCGCGAVHKSGRLARLCAWLTGIEPRRPLADPRLESLRAFVCASRIGHAPAERYAPMLAAQGFNARQIDALALLAA